MKFSFDMWNFFVHEIPDLNAKCHTKFLQGIALSCSNIDMLLIHISATLFCDLQTLSYFKKTLSTYIRISHVMKWLKPC